MVSEKSTKIDEGKENSISLSSNIRTNEHVNTTNRIHSTRRAGKIIASFSQRLDYSGRAKSEENEKVRESIRKTNAEGTIIAPAPFLRETLNLI